MHAYPPMSVNSSSVNRMVTICNEKEGTEYEVVTSEIEDEGTDIGLENIKEIEKDGDGMKDIGQANNDYNRIENKLKRSRTELESIHRYKKHPLLPPCGDKFENNCQNNIDEVQRLIIHLQYTSKNYDERRAWIRANVHESVPKCHRKLTTTNIEKENQRAHVTRG